MGDLISEDALRKIQIKMQADPVGKQILSDQPRVTDETWPIDQLLTLPENTFGY